MIRVSSFLVILICAAAPVAAIPMDDPVSMEEAGKNTQSISVLELWNVMRSAMADSLVEWGNSLEPEMKAAFKPTGPAEKNWSKEGLDIDAYLESLPGKTSGNALLTLGSVPSLEFRGPVPASIMAGWETVYKGSQSLGPTESLVGEFVALGPRHVLFVGTSAVEKVDAAFCMPEPIENPMDHFQIYRDTQHPLDRSSEKDIEVEVEALMMSYMLSIAPVPVICMIFHKDPEGLIEQSVYDEAGRPIGHMSDANDVAMIVQQFDLRSQLTSKAELPIFGSDGAVADTEPKSDAN